MDETTRYRADEAHAYLERVRQMGDDCAGMREQVEDAKARLYEVRGIDYARQPGSPNANVDAIPNAVASVQDAVAAYIEKLAEFEDERRLASMAVDRLADPSEARVLRLRYLLGWKWERICYEMGYSWQGMMSLRLRALSSFYDVIPHRHRESAI